MVTCTWDSKAVLHRCFCCFQTAPLIRCFCCFQVVPGRDSAPPGVFPQHWAGTDGHRDGPHPGLRRPVFWWTGRIRHWIRGKMCYTAQCVHRLVCFTTQCVHRPVCAQTSVCTDQVLHSTVCTDQCAIQHSMCTDQCAIQHCVCTDKWYRQIPWLNNI